MSSRGLSPLAARQAQPFVCAGIGARLLSGEAGREALMLRQAAGAPLGIAVVTGPAHHLDPARCAALGVDLQLHTPPRRDHFEAALTRLLVVGSPPMAA